MNRDAIIQFIGGGFLLIFLGMIIGAFIQQHQSDSEWQENAVKHKAACWITDAKTGKALFAWSDQLPPGAIK